MTATAWPGSGETAPTQWDEELRRYRRMTDPVVDEAITRYRAACPHLTEPRDLIRAVIADLAVAKAAGDSYDGPLHSVFELQPPLPAWADDLELLRRGQAVFNDHGVNMGTALCFASLPIAYAAADGAEALARTSDLATGNLTRRIGETGQMMIDVMGTRDADTLRPGGRGYATAVGLRLLHGCVRSVLTEPDQEPPWPTEELGPPLNQEILLGTLMDFTIVTWAAMERIGDELSADERRAHLYTWSVVGHLMGVEACRDRPLELADVEALTPLLARHFHDTMAGRRLMDGLLTRFESFMPLGWRKLPRSLVHWLFEDAPDGLDRVPGLLGVRPPAWWSRPMFALMRAANRTSVLAPIRPVLNWIMRRAGRLVLLAFADGFAPASPPFRIPEPLAQAWGLRLGGLPQRARALRHHVRTRARGVLGRRSPGGAT